MTQTKKVGAAGCKHGHNGSCCCNCKFQMKLMCHPMNGNDRFDKIRIGHGRINQQMGWVCMGLANEDVTYPNTIFLDKGHGMCEMHEPKESASKKERRTDK